MKKTLKLFTVSLLAVLALSSCKDEDNYIKSTGISIDQTSIALQVGSTQQLVSTISPSNATSQAIAWSSGDTKIAEVDNTGLVKAIAPGSTTISVMTVAFRHSASCNITVNPVDVTGVSLDKTTLDVIVGETQTLSATVSPSNATYNTIIWKSSNESIATVKDGAVYGVKPGDVTITATSADGKKSASCTINVTLVIPTQPETLDLWKNDAEGYLGIYGGSAAKTSDWLSYNGKGVLTWTANKTGAARTATIDFSTGSKVTITQVEAADFKGEYTFTAKVFNNESSSFISAGNKVSKTVTIGKTLLGETLKDGAGKTHTNSLGVDGLYHSGLIADATVELDYTAKSATLGLFLDTRTAQKDPSPVYSTAPYIAFVPELCSRVASPNLFYSPWFFGPSDFGTPDYEWIWFTGDLNSFSYTANNPQEITTSNPNNYGKYICGIAVVAFKTAEATDANSYKGDYSGYNIIYQFNTNNDSVGLLFTKK